MILEEQREQVQVEVKENISEAEFTTLFNTYRSSLCQYVFRMTKSMAVAEDVIHDVFVKIWMKKIDLSAINNCWSFLYVLTRNRLLDILKKSNREVSIDIGKFESRSQRSETEDMITNKEYAFLLQKITLKMPQQRRRAFRLVKEKGFTHKETAVIMKLSDLTVKKHVSSALKFIDHHFQLEGITRLQ